jgi:hypothetical protein
MNLNRTLQKFLDLRVVNPMGTFALFTVNSVAVEAVHAGITPAVILFRGLISNRERVEPVPRTLAFIRSHNDHNDLPRIPALENPAFCFPGLTLTPDTIYKKLRLWAAQSRLTNMSTGLFLACLSTMAWLAADVMSRAEGQRAFIPKREAMK